MSARPAVTSEVLADLVAVVPPRVSKRLDANPRAADGWQWTFADTVTIAAGEETVTLAAAGVFAAKDATCTCLLAPRCFHLLAVLTVLPLADAEPAPAPPALAESDESKAVELAKAPASTARTPTDIERGIAHDASRLGATILADGLSRVSTLRMGEALRVVHACRREGLPRLESAALAVYESVRDLRDRSPSFRLKEAASRLAELLLVAYRLGAGDPDLVWRGVGRRSYHAVGGLRLAGIGCEPVLQRGYAGVVTYLTDGDRVYSAQEVLPGETERARHAYDAQLRFGETSLTHGEASRGGLLFARAEVSADGRLGAGREVTCVSTARDAKLVAGLFSEPFAVQVARADRGERMGLVFLEGVVRGANADTAWISCGALSVPLFVPIDDVSFAYRENLARLVRAEAKVSLVARIDPTGAGLSPIAVRLTTSDGDRAYSLGYDRLAKTDLASFPESSPPFVPPAKPVVADVLDSVRRRTLRYALAGAASLPGAALPDVAEEAKRLRRALFAKAADGLEELATSDDERRAARVWLGLHVYTSAVERALARAAWADG